MSQRRRTSKRQPKAKAAFSPKQKLDWTEEEDLVFLSYILENLNALSLQLPKHLPDQLRSAPLLKDRSSQAILGRFQKLTREHIRPQGLGRGCMFIFLNIY